MASQPSSSAFYNRLRQSVVGTPAGAGTRHSPTPPVVLDTMAKLRSLAAKRDTARASPPPQLNTMNSAAMASSGFSAGNSTASPVAVPPHSAASVHDGDGLTPNELEAIRVAEIDSKFSVSAAVSNDTSQPMTFTKLADETTVKVFPRHVVFSRVDGSPIVELVIAELFELTEDATKDSLSFHLQRASGTAVIEVSSASSAARSVLYKLVCAKRNALEQMSP